MDAVEPLLKDITWAWFEVVPLQGPEPVSGITIGITIVAAQGLNWDPIGLSVQFIDEIILAHSALFGSLHLFGGDTGENFEIETLVCVVGDELRNNIAGFRDDPARCHRYHPAGLRATRLQAVEIRFRPVAVAIVLDPQRRNLPIHRLGHLALRPLNLGTLLRRGANDIERPPGQHAGDGVEIRGIDIAAEPGGLEGDGAATAEGVADPRPMAVTQDAQLLDQLLMGMGFDPQVSQMVIHGRPDRGVEGGLIQLLRALAESRTFLVGGPGRQGAGQQVKFVRLVDVPAPADAQPWPGVEVQRELGAGDLFSVRLVAPM